MLTFRDPSSRFRAEAPTLAILPLACQEESFLVEAISQWVAKSIRQPCFLAPVWPYGDGSGSTPPSMSFHLRSETLQAVVGDMVQSLFAHGFTRVAVINSLGSCTEIGALPHGNTVVKTAVRQLNYENPGMTVLWVQPLRAAHRQLRSLFGDDLDNDRLKHLLAEPLTASPDSVNQPEKSPLTAETALDEICRATTAYIETTFLQLDRIKSENPR